MTVIDIRAEIANQIKQIPDSEQTLLRILKYVRNLAKKTHPVQSSHLAGEAQRLWVRLQELSSLPAFWDGEKAIPIENSTIKNMQKVLCAGKSDDFHGWILFPDDNGTLLLQSSDGHSSISIGNNTFSFVYEKGGKVTAGEDLRFSSKSILKVLRASKMS